MSKLLTNESKEGGKDKADYNKMSVEQLRENLEPQVAQNIEELEHQKIQHKLLTFRA